MVVVNTNNNANKNEGWGLGLLFIFFHNHHHHQQLHPSSSLNNNNNKKRNYFTSSSSSSNLLISKTQSTLSICALLLFTTLLLFTLSTFEPTTKTSTYTTLHHHHYNNTSSSSRRFLQEKPTYYRNANIFRSKYKGSESHLSSHALHGIGELYLRGSKAMSDLIVGHVSEECQGKEIRSFIQVVLHSGLLSRADLVFVFPSLMKAAEFGPLVRSECDSLLRVVQLGSQLGGGELGSGLSRYLRPVGEGGKETMWGKGRGANSSSVGDLTRTSYGSVVGFDSSELDPEDTLSGFLDHVPMSLRRWACYPMLLGRLRRNFKHMMLVDVANTVVLSDPFTRVRNRSSESVFIWSNSVSSVGSNRHGKRNSGKSHGLEQKTQLNPGVVIGGSRGVRRFANAALTEIVRASIEHKGKNRNSVSELSVVNQLVHSGHLLKSINLIMPSESIPESGSLAGFNSADSGSSFLGLSEYFSVVKRGGSFDLESVVMREICMSSKLLASVYSDCLGKSIS